jgi:hypothetical protein
MPWTDHVSQGQPVTVHYPDSVAQTADPGYHQVGQDDGLQLNVRFQVVLHHHSPAQQPLKPYSHGLSSPATSRLSASAVEVSDHGYHDDAARPEIDHADPLAHAHHAAQSKALRRE